MLFQETIFTPMYFLILAVRAHVRIQTLRSAEAPAPAK